MRLEAQAKAGFYPTPPEVVDIIQSWIGDKKPGPRRLLDPCCGTGEPAAHIAAAAECDAYGVEINKERAQVAQRILTKVVAGNLFSVRARPEGFSILYLNPPYDFDQEDGRTELSFLKHTLPILVQVVSFSSSCRKSESHPEWREFFPPVLKIRKSESFLSSNSKRSGKSSSPGSRRDAPK